MTETVYSAMSRRRPSGGESAVALCDSCQQVAQGLARLQEALQLQGQEAMRREEEAERRHQEVMRRQEQAAEQRLQDALRLQEQRAETALRDAVRQMEAKLEEQDDAIRALVQRLEEKRQTVAVVEGRAEGLAGSAGEGALSFLEETQEREVVVEVCEEQEAMRRLEGRMQEVEASLQRTTEMFSPRVDGLLRNQTLPQTAPSPSQTSPPRSSSSPSPSSTSSDETCSELATEGGAASDRSPAFSISSSTVGSALRGTLFGDKRGEQGVCQGAEAMDEWLQRQRIDCRVQDVKERMRAARHVPYQQREALLSAIRNGRLGEIQRLLDAGADINYIDQYGIIPLLDAVQTGQHDVVALLLQRGADAKAIDDSGTSAMHFAAKNKCSGRCVDLLVAAGGDVNARNWVGATPLHWAVKGKHEAAVRALLSAGARKDLRIWDGPAKNEVPLHCATSAVIRNLLHS